MERPTRTARLANFATALLAGAAVGIVSAPAWAEVALIDNPYTLSPLHAVETTTPVVMINLSNDHQLYIKAYDDYTDLDRDGDLETTYTHDFDYYGYFDSGKCYAYDTSDQRFEPRAIASDRYCEGAASDYWSGNFLNWATMTRMDAMRRLWFGGARIQPEPATGATLERVYLPHDAHSFAKYYDGVDIDRLTPFQRGRDYKTSEGNLRERGITICNTTDVPANSAGSDARPKSESVTSPPLMKVMAGNYSLWASNERWQCMWKSGSIDPVRGSGRGHNGNGDGVDSGIPAHADSPDRGDGLGEKDYRVHVQVCVDGLLEGNCKFYPSGAVRPTGLTQRYGDDDEIFFGLVSGSYARNKSGGVLLKNAAGTADEVDVEGDGRFIASVGGIDLGGASVSHASASGFVNAMTRMRIIGYQHTDGHYGINGGSSGDGTDRDNCRWGTNSFDDGECQNWGNPFAEIYLSSLRYLASTLR